MKPSDRSALEQRYQRQRKEARFTFVLGAFSIAALFYYYAHRQLLLYGDAVAHLNIARRVVDNRHPIASYGQLGTVWLPLQHIAMLPFVWNDALWRSGIAGAIPGMVAYVLGSLAVFRLVSARTGQVAAYLAAAIYALNPNLLYMQATAMNEPIFLAFFLWALVYLDEFLRATFPPESGSPVNPATMKPQRALEACGITMAGGALTRYDGWFVAIIFGLILVWTFVIDWLRIDDSRQKRALAKSLAEVLLLNALVPVYWLFYTYFVSGNALDFISGPYSAKAIALRTTAQGAAPYPGQHHLFTAALYFVKAAQLNLGAASWGLALFLLALAGTALAVWRFRRYGILLLLWLPLAFYALSIAYGSVPIYIPIWYPFSYYNVRYGLELLPVFAVFLAILAQYVGERFASPARPDDNVVVLDRRGCCQLPVCLWRNTDHAAGSAGELARANRVGTRLGELPVRAAAFVDPADVRGRTCGRITHGWNSSAPHHLRSRASRLGMGVARPGCSRRVHHRLPG